MSDECLSNKIPVVSPMAFKPEFRTRSGRGGLDIEDLPKHVRCVNNPSNGIIKNAVYAVGEPSEGFPRLQRGKYLCQIIESVDGICKAWDSEYLHNYEKWEPRPGDSILLYGHRQVITAIDPDFLGVVGPKIGVRVLNQFTGAEQWEALRVAGITPFTGIVPDSKYWNDNPTETESEGKRDPEISLAQAISQHTAERVEQRKDEASNRKRKQEFVEMAEAEERTAMTVADGDANKDRMKRIVQLRSEIPTTEHKLLAMKQEYKRLTE